LVARARSPDGVAARVRGGLQGPSRVVPEVPAGDPGTGRPGIA